MTPRAKKATARCLSLTSVCVSSWWARLRSPVRVAIWAMLNISRAGISEISSSRPIASARLLASKAVIDACHSANVCKRGKGERGWSECRAVSWSVVGVGGRTDAACAAAVWTGSRRRLHCCMRQGPHSAHCRHSASACDWIAPAAGASRDRTRAASAQCSSLIIPRPARPTLGPVPVCRALESPFAASQDTMKPRHPSMPGNYLFLRHGARYETRREGREMPLLPQQNPTPTNKNAKGGWDGARAQSPGSSCWMPCGRCISHHCSNNSSRRQFPRHPARAATGHNNTDSSSHRAPATQQPDQRLCTCAYMLAGPARQCLWPTWAERCATVPGSRLLHGGVQVPPTRRCNHASALGQAAALCCVPGRAQPGQRRWSAPGRPHWRHSRHLVPHHSA